MRFEFLTAGRIVFGNGTIREIGGFAEGWGERAFVVTGSSPGRAQALLDVLSGRNIKSVTFATEGEPTTHSIKSATEKARAAHSNMILGYGGGSAIDTAKAVAALLANGGEPLDYLEVIGKGKAVTKPSIPFIAIPTTAGTGAEVTHNAVMESPEHKVKVSLRSIHMFARLALVDPELTYSLPPEVTASTGFDALAQVIEPYLSKQSNPVTDAVCREGMSCAARSLKRAFEEGDNPSAREDMALASLFGGMALANAKLGAVHGFAGPLGGMYSAGHGALCAALLPYVMEVNLRAVQERGTDSRLLDRFREISRLLTAAPGAHAEMGILFLKMLCKTLVIPPLSSYGIKTGDFPLIIEKARASSSMKGNPVELADNELYEILEKAF